MTELKETLSFLKPPIRVIQRPKLKPGSVQQALIIAAGRGSRLMGVKNSNCPKPLVSVGGVPLLERVIRTLNQGGIRKFWVVIGYRGLEIKERLSCLSISGSIHWIENLQWDKQNGMSVLAAEPFIDGPFVLSMADHLFTKDLVKKIRHLPLHDEEIILAVDRNLQAIPDMEDATKVFIQNNQITAIQKNLTEFNAIDTGLFLGNSSLMQALKKAQKDEDCSLSDGVRELAKQQFVRAWDIDNGFWLDVDTSQDLKLAENHLYANLKKSHDGFLARKLNRPVSLRVTRWLADTSITPNQITFFLLGVGLLAGYCFAKGNYLAMLAGAILFQLQSILDGCDGEIARLKFQESRLGGILDVIADGLVTSIGFFGMGLGVSRLSGDNFYGWLGMVAALSVLGCTAMLFILVQRSGHFTGSFVSLSPFKPDSMKHLKQVYFINQLTQVLDLLSRRDYTYLVLILALVKGLSWFLWMASFGTLFYLFALMILWGVSVLYEKL